MYLTGKFDNDSWRQTVLTRIVTVLALVMAFLEIWRLSDCLRPGCLDTVTLFYYTICLIPIPIFLRSRNFTINATLMIFCVMCAVSLIFNDPVRNYVSALRFGLFVLMLSLISPLTSNEPLRDFRRRLWKYSISLARIAVILTLAGYFATLALNGNGNLNVFIGHYIVISIISALVSIDATCSILDGKKRSGWLTAGYIVTLIISIVLMIWGGARSAMIGFVIAQIYVLSYYYRRRKATKWTIAGILGIICISACMGGDVTYKVIKKFSISIEHNSLITSRERKWTALTEEFSQSPVVGIGFGNVRRFATYGKIEDVEFTKPYSSIEPGSSWLSVLSNTGIIGFVIMAYWNIQLLKKAHRRRKAGDNEAVSNGAILLLMITVGFFEGYILFAGSILFYFYWLLTSQICEDDATPQIP